MEVALWNSSSVGGWKGGDSGKYAGRQMTLITGVQEPIGSLIFKVIFCKRAQSLVATLQKRT